MTERSKRQSQGPGIGYEWLALTWEWLKARKWDIPRGARAPFFYAAFFYVRLNGVSRACHATGLQHFDEKDAAYL